MSEHESPAARRHRWVRAVRNADLQTAEALLEAYELLLIEPAPGVLDEVEQLAGWRYEDLLRWVINRAPAPTCGVATMQAKDLLDGRQRQLAGLLSLAAEQAWSLGDLKTCKSMARLSNTALIRCIGEPALMVGLGGEEDPEPGEA